MLEQAGGEQRHVERRTDSDREERIGSIEDRRGEASASRRDDDFDWKEYIKDRGYDDISYRQWEDRNGEDRENSYEQYVSSDITLSEHLMFQLECATERKGCRRVGEYIIESLDEKRIHDVDAGGDRRGDRCLRRKGRGSSGYDPRFRPRRGWEQRILPNV